MSQGKSGLFCSAGMMISGSFLIACSAGGQETNETIFIHDIMIHGAEHVRINHDSLDQGYKFTTSDGSVVIEIDAEQNLLVAVGASAPQLEIHAVLNEETCTDGVWNDSVLLNVGVFLVIHPGDQLRIRIIATEDAQLEGLVLLGEPSNRALGSVGTDWYKISTVDGPEVTSQGIAEEVAKRVKKGIVCAVVRAWLESDGAICPDKPWWLPNPGCVWEATTCHHIAR